MEVVSSSITVILKFFLPTIWIVFFSTFTIGLVYSSQDFIGSYPIWMFRVGMFSFLVLGILALYWAVMKLKRVEMDSSYFYATNYRATYRYSYPSIEKMEERDYLFFKTIHIYLKKEGNFGKKISFIASKRFSSFVNRYPHLFKGLIDIETPA